MKKIRLLCLSDNLKLNLKQGIHSLYYQCPKYNIDYRLPGEKACHNHLTCLEAESIKKMIVNNKQYIKEDCLFNFKKFIIKVKEDKDYINVYVRRNDLNEREARI